MSAKSATLAKSLHTVSALVSVARLHRSRFTSPDLSGHMLAVLAVQDALRTLGYAGAADPYGLAARAVAILEKDAQ